MSQENQVQEEDPNTQSVVLDQSYYSNSNPHVIGALSVESTAIIDQSLLEDIVPTATLARLPMTSNSMESSIVLGDDSFENYSTTTQSRLKGLELRTGLINSNETIPAESGNADSGSVDSVEAITLKRSGTLSGTALLMKPIVTVGVHDGRFHADEVMGVSLLKILYDILNVQIQLFRSRDADILSKCDIVLDVGHIYDPNTRRFDHHQKSCCETFSSKLDDSRNGEEDPKKRGTILLSSAGMTWKEFGKVIIDYYLEKVWPNLSKVLTSPEQYLEIIDTGYTRIYDDIIREVDAHDNGQSMIYEDLDYNGLYRYKKHLDLGNTISKLNHELKDLGKTEEKDEKDKKDEKTSDQKKKEAADLKNKQFLLAVDLTEETLHIHLKSILGEIIDEVRELPALRKLYDDRPLPYLLDIPNDVSNDPKLVSRVDKKGELLFTIYYQEHSGNWAINTRQIPGHQFLNKKNLLSMEVLKEKLTAEEYSQVVFVHKALFCGAARNHDLAIKICTLSNTENPLMTVPMKEAQSTLVGLCAAGSGSGSGSGGGYGIYSRVNVPCIGGSYGTYGTSVPFGNTFGLLTASICVLFVGYSLVKIARNLEN